MLKNNYRKAEKVTADCKERFQPGQKLFAGGHQCNSFPQSCLPLIGGDEQIDTMGEIKESIPGVSDPERLKVVGKIRMAMRVGAFFWVYNQSC